MELPFLDQVAMKREIRGLSIFLLLICTIGSLSAARSEEQEEGEVYVAGQNFTLEQALNQALAENPPDARRRFWVVVSGRDAVLLTKAGANPGLLESIERARRRGGIIYVCQSDMRAQGIKPSGLIPGVLPVQGFGGAAADANAPPLPQSDTPLPRDLQHARLILRSCADNAPVENSVEPPNAAETGGAQ